MINVSDQILEKIKTQFYIQSYFPKVVPFMR